jgi:cold shock CspA family protein
MICEINLMSRIHIAREEADVSNFALGLQKQLQMVGLLLYYRETNTMPSPNSFGAIGKLTTQVILLESRKRFNLIKDYYFTLSEPAKLRVEDWPAHFGTIKAINQKKNTGYITSEGNPDVYFHLNETHQELKDGSKVVFNLPITKKGGNGPYAVYVKPVK